MGMDMRVYVGFYVVSAEVEILRKSQKRCCTATDICGRPAENSLAAFCSYCGAPVGLVQVEKPVRYALRPDEVSDGEWGENMFAVNQESRGPVHWLPNVSGFGDQFDEGSDGAIAWDSERLGSELTRFKAEFQPLLDAAKAEYGVDLPIAFGAVAYWS